MFLNRKKLKTSNTINQDIIDNRNSDIACYFIVAEILMALEQIGILELIANGSTFSTTEMSRQFKLDEELFEAICEFLAEQDFFNKSEDRIFYMRNHKRLQITLNFLLAYKNSYEGIGDLLTGSKKYGHDISRDSRYLRKTYAYSREANLFIIKRLKELNIRDILDIGCGSGKFLLDLAKEIPNSKCFGIDIDKDVVMETTKSIIDSPYKNTITILQGDGRFPESLPQKLKCVQAITSATVFHEFRKENQLIKVLKKYKGRFPDTRLFITEFNIPDWNTLRSEKKTRGKKFASFYLFTHYLSKQGLPQSTEEWLETITESGWQIAHLYKTRNRLVVFDCK